MSKMSLFPKVSNLLTAEDFVQTVDCLDISYGDLAKRLDVDRKTITRWADGTTPIPGAVALLLNVAYETKRLGHECSGPGVAQKSATLEDLLSKRNITKRIENIKKRRQGDW